MDVLGDVLHSIHLRGTVYFQLDFSAPWGMKMDAGSLAQFHIVVRGACWLESATLDAPLALSTGDVLMFPHGDAHILADKPDSQYINGRNVLDAYREGAQFFCNGDLCTTLVCGHFEFNQDFEHPFLRDLPSLIHIPGRHQPVWLENAVQMIIQESKTEQHGSSIIVDRLADVLFVHTLRAYLELIEQPAGSLIALKDNRINQSLKLIHQQPEHDWTLQELATRVSMSRASFATRFRELMGETPMRYITLWRMQTAMGLLRHTDLPLASIADRVGYTSEASFSRAFKRQFNRTPGSHRRK